MAAYAASAVVSDVAAQVLAGTPLRVLRGRLNITNYNAVLAEITGITQYFRTTPTVILGGVFEGGNHVGQWVPASKSVKAWVTTTGAEVADDVDVGEVDFIAMGVAP